MECKRYSKEKQLAIGKEIYDGLFTIGKAAAKYGVNYYTARDYYRLYKDINNLPSPRNKGRPIGGDYTPKTKRENHPSYNELKVLNQDQLINEVIKARVEAERAKKGYTVKGDGQTKEYIILNKENTK